MKYIGIDGCKLGWFSVSINGNNDWAIDIYSDILSLSTDDTSLVLIDVPIGLPYDESRKCDLEARKLLTSARGSSVFPTPCREATRATDYREACLVNEKHLSVRLSQQSWNICNKIAEVDEFIIDNKDSFNIRESHPEVCFWALAGGRPMEYNKKRKKGQEERLELLQSIYSESNNIYEKALSSYMRKEVAKDDILDALVLAVTGYISGGQLESIPEVPEYDQLGLPMEIVYSKQLYSHTIG